MPSRAQQYQAKVLECEQRAAATDDPGVRKAYERVAAQLSDITQQIAPPGRRYRRGGKAASARRASRPQVGT